ncbi:MAG: hypothetical protein IJC25_02620 [Clostridia bacterium]|nr:hypothetical protein [Clostridia bacterium]
MAPKNQKATARTVWGVAVAALTVTVVAAVAALSGQKEPPALPSSAASAVSETSVPVVTESVPLPVSTPSAPLPVYEYGAPLPQTAAVDDSYFNDAIFLGASRTDLFVLRTDVEPAATYAFTGMTVEKVFTEPVVEDGQGGMLTVVQALHSKPFAKAYLMFGVNECGWPNKNYFIRLYGDLIDAVRAASPDAVIYVQSILPVTQSKSDADPLENNTNIAAYNRLLQTLCAQKQVHLVDAAESVADENGVLPEEASVDGVHINRAYCQKWYDYLKTHTVDGGVQ